ncbi:MAG: hypothetical protein NW206_18190 [Hyphomonadaceae bacterium]|nr:hypothetical protein [Hyphomonadaceae bacterium]
MIFHFKLTAAPFALTALWGVLFAVLCLWFTVRPLSMLRWAPLQYLGERSYSLYLVHFPMMLLLMTPMRWLLVTTEPTIGTAWATAIAIAVVYASVVLVSAISYRLIERPGMELGRHFERRVATAKSSAAS